jgi:hypothetical protein
VPLASYNLFWEQPTLFGTRRARTISHSSTVTTNCLYTHISSLPPNMAGRVPTGFATETYISEHTFRQGHRAIEGGSTKKRKREGKGDTGVVSGAGAYKEYTRRTTSRTTLRLPQRSWLEQTTMTRKRRARPASLLVASNTTTKAGRTCMYRMVCLKLCILLQIPANMSQT